mmetsp:Transcript_27353/g.87864  ORF Transcript_27353/g.87864 Transcript_27353/m.87864 type:complete len:213 (-) Transcript_27353:214-852(-)
MSRSRRGCAAPSAPSPTRRHSPSSDRTVRSEPTRARTGRARQRSPCCRARPTPSPALRRRLWPGSMQWARRNSGPPRCSSGWGFSTNPSPRPRAPEAGRVPRAWRHARRHCARARRRGCRPANRRPRRATRHRSVKWPPGPAPRGRSRCQSGPAPCCRFSQCRAAACCPCRPCCQIWPQSRSAAAAHQRPCFGRQSSWSRPRAWRREVLPRG